MHRLIVFDAAGGLAHEGWRLPAAQVADVADSVELLAHCRRRLAEIEELGRVKLEQAAAEGFAAGFAQGQAEARLQAAERLSGFLRQVSIEQARGRAAVGRLAMEVVHALLADLGEGRAFELFVARRLEDLRDERPLAVRVPGGRQDAIDAALRERGVVLRVLEDPTLAADECAFELTSGAAHARVSLQLESLEAIVAAVEAGLVGSDADVG